MSENLSSTIRSLVVRKRFNIFLFLWNFKFIYNIINLGGFMFAQVLIEIKAKSIDKTFTYSIPNNLKGIIKIGIRVIVPFGNRKLEGFVIDIGDYDIDYNVKAIIDIVDNDPILTKELIDLGRYMSKKTLSNLISCYQTMLPKALKASYKTNINKKYKIVTTLIDNKYCAKNSLQKQIIDILKINSCDKQKLVSISASSYKTLLKNQVIKEEKKEIYRLVEDHIGNDKKIVLTFEQSYVVNKVLEYKDKFQPFLLHGVTGSGKTEVYMNIIDKIIPNKEVIVLVPEISLTPQFVDIFKRRFGSTVAIMHSGLSDGERYDEYRKIKEGKVKIVIGARSAIFSPFNNLGIIIIDEEHTDTYKQENNPRYDAIDIALKRAQFNNIPLLLGSATPSIESYTRAKLGIYQLLELKSRINKNMPIVKLIDMKNEIRKGNNIFSQILLDSIHDCLNKDEQIILLLNRRGYSTTVTCNDCGYVMKCPNCDIPLTYHKKYNKMNCHYCDYSTFKINVCTECGSHNISSYGIGTEKIEEALKEIFNTNILRMDVDTTIKKGRHKKILDDFRHKKAHILVGTQMIAKGLDFESVTLVGVLNGDASLNIPDFRSAERTFDLLNQVSGRSGRGSLSGQVIIQGFNLDHYSIQTASTNDYLGFYNEEMKIRKRLEYPPYINLTLIKVSGLEYDMCYKEAYKIKHLLERKNIKSLGPSSSNISKINNKYYVQVILKYKHLKMVYQTLVEIKNMYQNNNKINVDIDINPKRI